MTKELAPVSDLFRHMRWSRDQGYDAVLRDANPIPVERHGNRYFVLVDDLARLREVAP